MSNLSGNDNKNPFKMVGTIASLGNIFAQTIEEKNAWKERMIRAGINGIDFPENWAELPEDEKEKRLDAIIAMANE